MPLSNQDFKQIGFVVDQKINKLRSELKAEIANLITRNEFLDWMDKIWTELKKIGEEQVFMRERVRRNTEDIEVLKTKS